MILNNQITIKLLGLAWYQFGYFCILPNSNLFYYHFDDTCLLCPRVGFQITASRITYFRGQEGYHEMYDIKMYACSVLSFQGSLESKHPIHICNHLLFKD
jgi:hypothetical protein